MIKGLTRAGIYILQRLGGVFEGCKMRERQRQAQMFSGGAGHGGSFKKSLSRLSRRLYRGWAALLIFACAAVQAWPAAAKDSPAAPAPPGGAQPSPNALEQFFPFIILGLLFYFLLIRPQQRKIKQHGSFLSKIKRGDEVLTSSGIFGRIEGLTDQFAVLEVADNVRIRVVKSQIASYARPKEGQEGGKAAAPKAGAGRPARGKTRKAAAAGRGKKRV